MSAERRKMVLSCLGGLLSLAMPHQPNSLEESEPLRPVVASDLFVAAQCIDCDIAGYLVLRTRQPFKHLKDTSYEFQAQLGVVLGKLERAIMTITGADHVYMARFSEALASVHFHLFPRTAALGQQFIYATNNSEHGVNGPLL